MDIMDGFRLFMTTKLGNPAYSPEVSAKTSIIDFTVTMRGLEDQLLGMVILRERKVGMKHHGFKTYHIQLSPSVPQWFFVGLAFSASIIPGLTMVLCIYRFYDIAR